MFTPRPKSAKNPGTPLQRVRYREAAGVLIIALIILAITLARYWHNIAWSAH